MVFKEAMGELKPARNFTLNVFATDLDKDAINKARAGIYPANIAADVSPERLSRFFTKVEQRLPGGHRDPGNGGLCPAEPHHGSAVYEAGFLSCRNLLIYLAPEMQKKLIPLFHYSLSPGGILFLGSAETVGGFTDLFASLAARPGSIGEPSRPRRRAN